MTIVLKSLFSRFAILSLFRTIYVLLIFPLNGPFFPGFLYALGFGENWIFESNNVTILLVSLSSLPWSLLFFLFVLIVVWCLHM